MTHMHIDTDFGLNTNSSREIKKLYFVLLRIVQEDTFLAVDDQEMHSQRLYRVFLTSVPLYQEREFTALDLEGDFLHLFDKLIQASLMDEYYEKTANLQGIRVRFLAHLRRREQRQLQLIKGLMQEESVL
jgi:hypothetical protein